MNNIKKWGIVLWILMPLLLFAQQGQNRDKIKSLKIAFITEQLNLSSQEAQAFWPVYNEHEEKAESFRRTERREIRAPLNNLATVSKEDADELVDRFIKLQEDKHIEEQSFITEMRKILPAKKIILLMKSEEDFKRRLIRQYRQNRRGR